MRLESAVATVLLSILLSGAAAHAQQKPGDFPVRAVRLVVPYPPGASNDIVARLLGQKLSEAWGQQLVIDNRSGGGGLIGAEIVARASPDGYTLLMTNPGSNAINFALRAKTPYRPEDFASVTLLGWSPIMLLTSAAFPAANMNELIAIARAKPGQLSGGSSGTGGSSHLALEFFKMLSGTDILHVPYKGAAPAITDMIAGQVSIIFTTPVTAQAMIRAGKIKALAVAGNRRLDVFPDVPTTSEQGMKGYDVNIWFGISAPAGTPRPLILRIARDLHVAIASADVKERFAGLGLAPQVSTPEAFDRLIREDIERWSTVVKAAKLAP
jgi:tripartite-type tricarboxylate transporter receptor subunit TctC